MQFLEFTFQSFWHFAGIWLLLAVAFVGTSNLIAAFRAKHIPGPEGAVGAPGPMGPMGMRGDKGDVGICNCKCNDLKH